MRKPARLLLARHKEQVGASINLSRKILVERRHKPHFAAVSFRKVAEETFVNDVTRAENHKLHVLVKKFFEHARYEIEPFMFDKPCNHRDDGHFVLDGKPEHGLKPAFVFKLFGGGSFGVVCEDFSVRLGVVIILVYAVQNAL